MVLAQRIKEVQDKGVEDVCKEGINYNDGPMESKICSEGNKDVRKETGSTDFAYPRILGVGVLDKGSELER